MFAYTDTVLALIDLTVDGVVPASGKFTIEDDFRGNPQAIRPLEDGTLLVAANDDYRPHWTADSEPTLRLMRFTDEAWARHERPFATATTAAVTSPAAIARAVDGVGVTANNWLAGWHRRSMTTLAHTYCEEIAALAKLGLMARAEDASHGWFSLVVDLPDGDRAYIGNIDQGDHLPLADKATLEGWRIDRVDHTGDVVPVSGASGTPTAESVSNDVTVDGLARLAISSGLAPGPASLPPFDPAVAVSIPDVAARVIAELDPIAGDRLIGVNSLAELGLAISLDVNLLADEALLAYERQSGRSWPEYAADYQGLVSEWIASKTDRHSIR